MIMRKVIGSQSKLGQVAIEDVEFHPSDRSDIARILKGLQCVWKSEKHQKEAKEIMEGYLPAGVNPSLGRPGMDWWRVTVLANLKQGLNCDFDYLRSLANYHHQIRQMLGHSDLVDDGRYTQQMIVDNVNLLPKEALDRLSRVVVACRHELV